MTTQFATTSPLTTSQVNSISQKHLLLTPVSITSPTHMKGEYHKIYILSYDTPIDDKGTREVILRVARPAFPGVKVRNEIGWLEFARRNEIPVPRTFFWEEDCAGFGYEYMGLERIPHPSLDTIYLSFPPSARESIVTQIAQIFVKQWNAPLPRFSAQDTDGDYWENREVTIFGGLSPTDHEAQGGLVWGPYLEESMWEIGETELFLPPASPSSPASLNPVNSGPYKTYLHLLYNHIQSYLLLIPRHPSLIHLIPLIHPTENLLKSLEPFLEVERLDEPDWINRVKRVRARWTAGDMHFGNILVAHPDPEEDHGSGSETSSVLTTTTRSKLRERPEIASIIDWEFSKTLPAFYNGFSPIGQIVGLLHSRLESSDLPENFKRRRRPIFDEIPGIFEKALQTISHRTYEEFKAESDELEVLGIKGAALKKLREYLRSCCEVGVRGGRREMGEGEWKGVCEDALGVLGFEVEE